MFEPSTVEVAVDAVGAAGGRTYTYTVPDRFAGLAAGEAVIVEFGRRQALGIVLGPVAAPDGVTMDLKPILTGARCYRRSSRLWRASSPVTTLRRRWSSRALPPDPRAFWSTSPGSPWAPTGGDPLGRGQLTKSNPPMWLLAGRRGWTRWHRGRPSD
jgi:hypothetical protein